jgi:outer membrane protein assembly factor BamB
LYSVPADAFTAAHRDKATFPTKAGPAGVLPGPAISADGDALCWTEARAGGRIMTFVASTASPPASTPLPGAGAQAAASAQLLAGKLLVPLKSGSVALLEGETGRPASTPFVPSLMPGSLPDWSRPALAPNGKGFWIADGRRSLYSVLLKTEAPASLSLEREIALPGALVSPIVFAGNTAYGLVRSDEGAVLMSFEVDKASPPEKVPLASPVRAGPFAVGGVVLVDAQPAGLICLDGSKTFRWTVAPGDSASSPLAGQPLLCPGGDILVIDQTGQIQRLDANTGKQVAAANINQPVTGSACILGQSLIVAGSDGVLHRIALPQRP